MTERLRVSGAENSSRCKGITMKVFVKIIAAAFVFLLYAGAVHSEQTADLVLVEKSVPVDVMPCTAAVVNANFISRQIGLT